MRTIIEARKHRLTTLVLAFFLALLSACAADNRQPFAPEPETTTAKAAATYRETYRPQFHFSPPTMWMNDPNGMVHFDGEYHLFYQYYPEDTVWGPMHWGHAVSTDLVHWNHLPIALYPDELGYIFSGSAVVDWNNSSGFGRGDEPSLVAIFTYHDPVRGAAGTQDHETQGIAYSTDRGRTWSMYEGNPVLPNTQRLQDFRDPKVFWHEGSERWVMALSANDHVQFWASANLKSWSKLSEFGRGRGAHDGVWECPDLVEMPVEGTEEKRWVLIQNLNPGGPQGGSGTQYFVGDFDGRTFTLDPSFEQALRREGAVWLDAGRDNYAGVTWSDVPDQDGRTLFIGWMGNWDYAQQVPTHPWRSAMTLPRKLVLTRDERLGYRVHSRPVKELRALRGPVTPVTPLTVKPGSMANLPAPENLMQSEWLLVFDLPDPGVHIGVELSNALGEQYRFGLDDGVLYSDRAASGDFSFSEKFAGVHRSARLSNGDRLKLHLFIDAASVEAFVDDGANVMTDIVFPTRPFTEIRVYAEDRPVSLVEGRSWPIRSIWNEAASAQGR